MTRRWTLWAAALLCTLATAQAASPLARYIGDRDRAMPELERIGNALGDLSDQASSATAVTEADALQRHQDDILAGLQKALESVVGVRAIAGFPKGPALNLAGSGWGDYSALDGLEYRSADGNGRAVVTTLPLLRAWLTKSRQRRETLLAPPADIRAALRSGNFYTPALAADASITWYADIPLAAPPGGDFVMAKLANWEQDNDGAYLPTDLVVAAIRNDRVFIADEPVAPPIRRIPACQQPWDDFQGRYEAQMKALQDQYEARLKALAAAKPPNQAALAAAKPDQAALDRLEKAHNAKVGDYHRCFARQVSAQDYFPAVTRQAEDLLGRLTSAQ